MAIKGDFKHNTFLGIADYNSPHGTVTDLSLWYVSEWVCKWWVGLR